MPASSTRPIPESIVTTALAPAVSRSLHALVVLGVPDLLADGPLSTDELATRCGAHARHLHQALRAAATTGLLRRAPGRGWELTEDGRYLRSDHASSSRDLVLTQGGPLFSGSLDVLVDVLRTGRSGPELRFEQPLFTYLLEHAEEYASLNRMMLAYHGTEPAAVAEAFALPEGATVVDCGGGIGTLLFALLRSNPSTSGILFDQAPVVDQLGDDGPEDLAGRWEAVAGDFFSAVAAGDVHVLSHIVHDWDDDHAVAILRRCAEAGGPDARVLVVEEVVGEGDEPSHVKMLDVVLAAVTGGIERTREEYAALFAAAGLRLERVVDTASAVTVLEARPVGARRP